jgi:hypothetical protein
MCARIPVSLNSALMAGQARLILQSNRFAAVFPKRDQPANAFSTSGADVVAARPVAVFASLFLSFVARIKEKNFPHQGLGKFFKLRGVASLTNFGANVGGRRFFGGFLSGLFRGFLFRRPTGMGDPKKEHTSKSHEKKSTHDFSVRCNPKL